MNKVRVAVIAAAILVALTLFTAIGADLGRAWAVLRGADLKYAPAIVLCEALFFLLNSLSFYLVLPQGEVKFSEAVGANALAWLVDTIIPLAYVEGDVVRALALSRRLGAPRSTAASAAFRFTSASAFLTFVLVGSVVALCGGLVSGTYLLYTAVVLVLSVAAWTVLALAILRWDLVEGPLTKAAGKLSAKLGFSAQVPTDGLCEFGRSLKALGARKLLRSYVVLLAQWVVALASPLLALRSVGAAVSPWALSAGYAVLAAVSMASVGLPYSAGPLDAALAALFTALGVEPEVSVAATVLVRGASIATSTAIMLSVSGYYAYKLLGVEKLTSLREWAKAALAKPGSGENERG